LLFEAPTEKREYELLILWIIFINIGILYP